MGALVCHSDIDKEVFSNGMNNLLRAMSRQRSLNGRVALGQVQCIFLVPLIENFHD